jgi:hypothetical protein
MGFLAINDSTLEVRHALLVQPQPLPGEYRQARYFFNYFPKISTAGTEYPVFTYMQADTPPGPIASHGATSWK